MIEYLEFLDEDRFQMKKAIVFLVSCFVLSNLSGCQQLNRGAINNSTIGMGYSVTKQQYNNDEDGNNIHIEYPLLYSELHSMATSNEIIKNGNQAIYNRLLWGRYS